MVATWSLRGLDDNVKAWPLMCRVKMTLLSGWRRSPARVVAGEWRPQMEPDSSHAIDVVDRANPISGSAKSAVRRMALK
jgi:hypothetical protein